MPDFEDLLRPPARPGCLAATGAALVLATVSPLVLAVRSWRSWRRGHDIRVSIEPLPPPGGAAFDRQLLDVVCDVPLSVERGFRDRLTDRVVRVAEALRSPDDAYHVVYRPPGADEVVVLPLGPHVQSLGERFRLVLGHGALAGRTVIWLALGCGLPLSRIIDPECCDPESPKERERLVETPEARWSMATSWAVSGPSLVVRMILAVPAPAQDRVMRVFERLAP
jgi:hypothetical protein